MKTLNTSSNSPYQGWLSTISRISTFDPKMVLIRYCQLSFPQWFGHVQINLYGGFLRWGCPQVSILTGFSIINHPFLGSSKQQWGATESCYLATNVFRSLLELKTRLEESEQERCFGRIEVIRILGESSKVDLQFMGIQHDLTSPAFQMIFPMGGCQIRHCEAGCCSWLRSSRKRLVY